MMRDPGPRTHRGRIRKEALLEAARAVCQGCRYPNDPPFCPDHRSPGPDDWWHENHIRCSAGRILDLIYS